MLPTRKSNDVDLCDKLLIDTIELQTILSCGRQCAIRLAEEAGAKVQLGKRVFWSVEKISNHINSIAK